MEQLIITKKAREVGTSAGVLLPRSWLNKQVVVTLYEPSREKILLEVMSCLFEHKLNEEAKGVYLFGSYGRGDYEIDSDIDVLVLTSNTNEVIRKDNYEILVVSEDSFLKNLKSSLNYQSILREAKVVLNEELFDKYRAIAKKQGFDYRSLLKEIESVFKINKDTVRMCGEERMVVPDGVVYSLILRLRELYLIKCILSSKSYQKEDFLKAVGEKAYLSYLRVKRDNKELDNTPADELKNLLELSEKWLKELKD